MGVHLYVCQKLSLMLLFFERLALVQIRFLLPELHDVGVRKTLGQGFPGQIDPRLAESTRSRPRPECANSETMLAHPLRSARTDPHGKLPFKMGCCPKIMGEVLSGPGTELR